ncbi:MFS transporter [Candidatus Heimdallarchaeota archaeon]|nr:MAG: MFS transporter [Candidatus Heimdallarchaeota archaeon]
MYDEGELRMRKKHFASLSTFQIMAMFRRGIFYFFLSIYLKEFLGVSNTEMTLFATLPMIANIFAQSAIWGRISDKFKKRRLLIVFGEVFAALGYLLVFWIHNIVNKGKVGIGHISEVLFSQADLSEILNVAATYDIEAIPRVLQISAYIIIFGFTVIEAGWSSSNLGWTTLIADLTRESERSKTMGLLQFIGGIGNVLGVTASGFLYQDGFGFWLGDLFYISSGIMIFSIIALFLIPESYADLDSNYFEEEKDEDYKTEQPDLSLKKNNKKTQSNWPLKLFIWLIVVLAIVNIGGNSINQMIQIHVRLKDTFAASDQTVAWLRNTSSIAMIVGGLVIGFFTSKLGDGNMLLVGFLCAFIGTILLPIVPSIVVFFIYMALKGTSRVWIQTTAYSMVNRVVPLEKRGRMMGYYNAAFYLSWGMGGTLITGPIADAIVNSNFSIIMLYTILGLLVLGSLVYLLINKIANLKHQRKLIFYSSLGIFGSGLILLITFVSKPITSLLISSGNTDSYSYKITFYIAAILIAIGIIGYTIFRPSDYKKLVLDKNNKG